jgi:hypothetical protein
MSRRSGLASGSKDRSSLEGMGAAPAVESSSRAHCIRTERACPFQDTSGQRSFARDASQFGRFQRARQQYSHSIDVSGSSIITNFRGSYPPYILLYDPPTAARRGHERGAMILTEGQLEKRLKNPANLINCIDNRNGTYRIRPIQRGGNRVGISGGVAEAFDILGG